MLSGMIPMSPLQGNDFSRAIADQVSANMAPSPKILKNDQSELVLIHENQNMQPSGTTNRAKALLGYDSVLKGSPSMPLIAASSGRANSSVRALAFQNLEFEQRVRAAGGGLSKGQEKQRVLSVKGEQ